MATAFHLNFRSVGTVRKATLTLTNAQIKQLLVRDYEVVPAPGLGKWIAWVSIQISLNFVTGYAGWTDGDFFRIGQGAYFYKSVADSVDNLDELLGATGARVCDVPMYVPGCINNASSGLLIFIHDASSVDDTNWTIGNNGGPAMTGGHASNTMKVTVYYTIEDL